ncbi:MAG: hypothetical protein GEV13_10695 [Rhodospirillales bacterium]|nr:hypothetical protein [Rhodospirillales bacterium]
MKPTAQQIANFETRYFKPDFIEKNGDKPVPWKRLDKALARLRVHILDGIAPAVANLLSPMAKRIKELEATVTALQQANEKTLADSFRGAWMAGTVFARGSLAVHDGSLWIALANSDQKPGTSADWKLICKRGRDGKDAR